MRTLDTIYPMDNEDPYYTVQEAAKIRDLAATICEELWNHCLCDESENVVKRKMNPVSNETVDCFIVNADLIDHIFTNLSKLRNQNGFSVDTEINWNDEYPKGC